MMHFKLFELFDTEKTLYEVMNIFGEGSVLMFSNEIIGIQYDYHSTNSYVSVLQKVKDLNLRQLIITTPSFMNVIDYSVESELFINEMKYIYPISDDIARVTNQIIEKINDSDGKEKNRYKARLFREIDWLTTDECIDIKMISIKMIGENSPIKANIELYNNGVLVVSQDNVIQQVKELLQKTLK